VGAKVLIVNSHGGEEAHGRQGQAGGDPPPGEGEGIEEASNDAVEALEDQDEGARHAGYGDGG
jgi:hypothetical protein